MKDLVSLFCIVIIFIAGIVVGALITIDSSALAKVGPIYCEAGSEVVLEDKAWAFSCSDNNTVIIRD